MTFPDKERIIEYLNKVDSAEKAQDLITLLENDVFAVPVPRHLVQPFLYKDLVLVHWKEGKEYPFLGDGLDATTGERQIYYSEPDGTVIYNRTGEEMFKLVENYQGERVPRFITKEREQ